MPYVENSDNARIYSDMGTGVWIAPKGTTLPLDLAEPAAAFKPVGWLSDAGIVLAVEKDIAEFNALQGGALIRTKVGKVMQRVTFECLEETALVLGLVYADQPITVTGVAPNRIATQSITANQSKTVVRSVIVDNVDGAYTDRYTVSAMDLTFQGEVQLASNEELRIYRFTGTIIAGATGNHITNSPGMLPAV